MRTKNNDKHESLEAKLAFYKNKSQSSKSLWVYNNVDATFLNSKLSSSKSKLFESCANKGKIKNICSGRRGKNYSNTTHNSQILQDSQKMISGQDNLQCESPPINEQGKMKLLDVKFGFSFDSQEEEFLFLDDEEKVGTQKLTQIESYDEDPCTSPQNSATYVNSISQNESRLAHQIGGQRFYGLMSESTVIAKEAAAKSVRETPFIKDANLLALPSLQWDEIRLGQRLHPRGNSYDFYKVDCIHLKERVLKKDSSERQSHSFMEKKRSNEEEGDIEQYDWKKEQDHYWQQQATGRAVVASTAKSSVDSKNNHRYVLKCVRKEVVQNKEIYLEAVADNVDEAYLLASLNHEYIIKLRGLVMCESWSPSMSGQDAGYLLLLDNLRGGTLDRRIRDWRKTAEEMKIMRSRFGRMVSPIGRRSRHKNIMRRRRIKVALQIAEAMRYVHSMGILYRDLKPAKVGLVGNDGGNDADANDVRLFHFHRSVRLPRDDDGAINYDGLHKLSMAGTPRYMAPEVMRGEPYNFVADVYSYGVLLWELFSFNEAFRGMDVSALQSMAYGTSAHLSVPVFVPQFVRDMIEECCAFDRKRRPSFEEIVARLKCEM